MGFLWDLVQHSQIEEQSKRAGSLEDRVARLEAELTGTRQTLHEALRRLEQRFGEDLLRVFAEREPCRRVNVLLDGRKLRPDRCRIDVQRLPELRRPTIALAQNAEQHVLGADLTRARARRLEPREEHRAPRGFVETLEHGWIED